MNLKARKCAVVTGAGRGIGRETALCLAEEGYQVYICSRTEEELRETVSLGKNRHHTLGFWRFAGICQ